MRRGQDQMFAWWQSLHVGTRKRVVLLQVDIGGHSKWLEEAYERNHFEPYRERANLADQITAQLAFQKFHRVFWAGDGGLFAAELDSAGHPENLCEAADDVFKVFGAWREAKDVEIRVTGTTLELTIDQDPGKWCSPRLNDFLKYERHLALPNAFVITDELHAKLVSSASRQRFPKRHRVPLPNGREMYCYIDSVHPHNVTKSSGSFGAWLRQNAGNLGIHVEKTTLLFGGCTVLDAAPREHGYGDIVFELQQSPPTEAVLEERDRLSWSSARDALANAKQSGTSMCVARFIPELSDDPHPRLAYSTIPYVDARAFHSLFEGCSSTAARYREQALAVMGAGTRLPNILSTAIVVIVGNEEPELLIANRRLRPGGYSGNCWSVSIAEQFIPSTGERAGRLRRADISLDESVRRGVREELLGEDFAGAINVTTQAFLLENTFDNFAFLAIVDLRPMTFGDVATLWHNAPDHSEHQALAALPATEDVLRSCIGSAALPTEIWASVRQNARAELAVGVTELSKESHRWQPTSELRLASAWWHASRTKLDGRNAG